MIENVTRFCDRYLIASSLLEKMETEYDDLFRRIQAQPPISQVERRTIRREQRHNRGQPPQKCLFICYTNRSGSSFLADLLHLSDVCGRPQEYFTPGNVERISRRIAVETLDAYAHRLSMHRQSDNGVFATKVGFAELIYLHAHGLLERYFPNRFYIWLSREDTVMQAVSWYRAAYQKTWSGTHTQRAKADYDRSRIEHYLNLIHLDQKRWNHFFSVENLSPLCLTYEILQADTSACLEQIRSLLRLQSSLVVKEEQSRFSVQRDAISYEWAKRFQSESGQGH